MPQYEINFEGRTWVLDYEEGEDPTRVCYDQVADHGGLTAEEAERLYEQRDSAIGQLQEMAEFAARNPDVRFLGKADAAVLDYRVNSARRRGASDTEVEGIALAELRRARAKVSPDSMVGVYAPEVKRG